jgi:hypothetical protein
MFSALISRTNGTPWGLAMFTIQDGMAITLGGSTGPSVFVDFRSIRGGQRRNRICNTAKNESNGSILISEAENVVKGNCGTIYMVCKGPNMQYQSLVHCAFPFRSANSRSAI